ncbi:MAG TPA: CPBP family intramembrane glutamic endopeptidase [Pirellulales bacterium]
MNEQLLPVGDDAPNIVRMGLLFEGVLALAACCIGLFLTTPPWQRIILRPLDIVWGLLATLPLVLGLLIMRRIRTGPLGKLNSTVDSMLVPMFARCTILQLALISVMAGLGEELLFRGVLQPVLIGWLGIAAGLCIASVIFGLLHAVTITYAVLATIVGVYLGWLALATGNLLGPIIAHGLYDFVALVYLIRSTPRRQDEP